MYPVLHMTQGGRDSSARQDFVRAFLLCGLAAFCILLPFYLIDGGFFHYAGDFNSQQITFYRYANQLVKQGASYAWAADLGSDVVNAYSFYLLGSPFFWLSLLLPASWLPYCMAPLLVLKFAVAGGGAMLYLRRYVKSTNLALVGACLYALSGFAVYNVFFNHFVDVVALFPYLLWSLDETVYRDRRGLFCLFAALNLINNYFFFAGQIVFLVIYFVCKCITGEYRLTAKLFFALAAESLLAAAMGCVLAWPAVLSLARNPRTIDPMFGWQLLTYHSPQQYLAILFSWILPPDCPYMTGIWTEGTIKWTSMTAYLPLVSLAGVVAWWRCSPGGSSTKKILGTCAVFALVPGLNSLFYCMNASYYARWYYMPVLLLALATVQGLEDPAVDQKKGIRPVFWLMLSTLAFLLVPAADQEKELSEGLQLGVAEEPALLAVTAGFGLLGLGLYAWLWAGRRKKPRFRQRLLAGVLAFSCVFSITHIAIGKFGQWEKDQNIRAEYEGAVQLGKVLPAGSYRVDTYECRDNLGPWMGKSCLSYFGSTVTPSILELYPQLGVKRDVRTEPDHSQKALRSLMGVKYYILPESQQENFEKELGSDWLPTGLGTAGYLVYENQNDAALGLTYDYYVTPAQLEKVSKNNRAKLMLRAVVVEDPAQLDGLPLLPLPQPDFQQLNTSRWKKDCQTRRETGCTSFAMEKDGFTAAIRLEKENLVVFQVPWDAGFTACVNGQDTPILRVNGGMMAVRCPAGENEIVFTCRPAGFTQSVTVSLLGLALYGGYLVLFGLTRRRRPPVLYLGK